MSEREVIIRGDGTGAHTSVIDVETGENFKPPVQGVQITISITQKLVADLMVCSGDDNVLDIMRVNVQSIDIGPGRKSSSVWKCEDCNGEGQYLGLNKIEKCARCGGQGYV